jgi:hypothetical protein
LEEPIASIFRVEALKVGLPKHWYFSSGIQSIKSQKAVLFTVTASEHEI